MKVFLAGCEGIPFLNLLSVADHPNTLFSYYHWKDTNDASKEKQRNIFNNCNMEVICDSGLFTLMFGAGKGGNYDLEYMKNYTTKYIKTAQQMGINNLMGNKH